MLKIIKSSLKSTFIYSLGNISTKIVGLILIPIYTNPKYLSIAEFGVYNLLEVVLQILIAFFSFNLSKAFIRWYWDKEYINKQKNILFTSIIFALTAAALMYFIFSLFSKQLALTLLENRKYSTTFNMMVLCASIQILAEFPTDLMRIKEKAILFTLTNISKLIVSLTLTIYFVVYLKRGVTGIYEANILGFIFYLVILSGFILKNISMKIEIAILKEMLRFSVPLMFASISGIILSFADRFCIRFIGGIADVGIYSLGYRIANTIKVFVARSVFLALTPIQYKMMNQKGNKRFYSKILTYFTFGLMFFVIGLSLFGKEIIRVLAQSREYWAADKIIPVFTFIVLFSSMKQVCLIGLNIKKKTNIIAYFTIIIAMLNIILNLLLIPILHSIGAALATLISQLVFFVVIYRISQQYLYIPYEISKITKMVILGLIIIGAGLLINHYSLEIRILAKLGLIISFPIILYFLNFYEPIELLHLKQSWHKWRNPKNWKRNLSKIKFQ